MHPLSKVVFWSWGELEIMFWHGAVGIIMAKQPQLEGFGTNLAQFGPPAQLKRHEMVLTGKWGAVKSCHQGC